MGFPLPGRLAVFGMAASLPVSAVGASPAILSAQQPDPPTRFEAVSDSSSVVAVTGRAGLLSFLGHEHAIRAPEWSATLCLDPDRHGRGRADLSVVAASLEVDSDTARALADLGDGPGEDDREEIRTKMLGPENLAAEEYPEIRIEAVSTADDAGAPDGEAMEELPVAVAVTVRGRRVEYEGEVAFARASDGTVRIEGEVEIELRDFGIEPESVAGVVNVANEVDLLLRLFARPTAERCSPEG